MIADVDNNNVGDAIYFSGLEVNHDQITLNAVISSNSLMKRVTKTPYVDGRFLKPLISLAQSTEKIKLSHRIVKAFGML